MRKYFDVLSLIASVVCSIHCVVMPFMLAILPTVPLMFFQNHFNIYVAFFSLIVGGLAIFNGFQNHKNCYPFLFFSLGMICLLLSEFILCNMIWYKDVTFGRRIIPVAVKGHPSHYWVSILGGFMIGFAHIFNMRFCSSCKKCN